VAVYPCGEETHKRSKQKSRHQLADMKLVLFDVLTGAIWCPHGPFNIMGSPGRRRRSPTRVGVRSTLVRGTRWMLNWSIRKIILDRGRFSRRLGKKTEALPQRAACLRRTVIRRAPEPRRTVMEMTFGARCRAWRTGFRGSAGTWE
jgi:hypothetical protein